MKKEYCIYVDIRGIKNLNIPSAIRKLNNDEFKNQFETKEECVNFMLNPENAHFFQEDVEYLVFETFVKIKKK